MSLPSAWTERIFQKLSVTYGHHFLGRWAGMELDAVKADWGQELGMYARKPQALSYALENLPAGQPPTVIDFRALCARMPDTAMPALPAPSASGMKRIAEAMRPLAAGGVTPAELLARHQARRDRGEPMTIAQRDWLRTVEALKGATDTVASVGDFQPIDQNVWPPEMQAA